MRPCWDAAVTGATTPGSMAAKVGRVQCRRTMTDEAGRVRCRRPTTRRADRVRRPLRPINGVGRVRCRWSTTSRVGCIRGSRMTNDSGCACSPQTSSRWATARGRRPICPLPPTLTTLRALTGRVRQSPRRSLLFTCPLNRSGTTHYWPTRWRSTMLT